MTEQDKPSDVSQISVANIVMRIVIVLVILFLITRFIKGDIFGKKSIDAAEKYVNQQVYNSLGLVCDYYKSEIIFNEGDIKLVAVQFYLPDATSPSGSYCVYCKNGYVVNSTKMMGAEFPYKDEKTGERATLARSFSRTLTVKSRT